ncbi:chaplin [Streptomyces beigongshangae]|uniref:chaplin n=1 Tax=Streptomyces beigongshangae TaxID=2841597 RepID=UPI001C85B9DF|nr:chaplin [Streptomyces sp. REN17]
MKRVARNGLIIAAAASGAVGMVMPAHADSTADGAAAHSPGVISGNTLQLPVHVPVNACGNTVNVVGLLNPAAGNRCANEGGHGGSAGAAADAVETDSPGLVSGNGVQLPVDLPVNVTGNSVNVVGIGNPVFGNESSNTSGERPQEPVTPSEPKPVPPPKHPAKPSQPAEPAEPEEPGEREAPRPRPQGGTRVSLADTGSQPMGPTVAASAALMLGGAVLYRRFRSAAVRRSEG